MTDSKLYEWFGLSYAQYLTIPRSALQSMPLEWQNKMASLLDELDDRIDWRPEEGTYRCTLWSLHDVWDRDEQTYITKWHKELYDPLADYDRGRRRLPLNDVKNDDIDVISDSSNDSPCIDYLHGQKRCDIQCDNCK